MPTSVFERIRSFISGVPLALPVLVNAESISTGRANGTRQITSLIDQIGLPNSCVRFHQKTKQLRQF